MTHDNDNNLANDMLKGADGIAAFLGWDRRAVYHVVEKGHLPTFRIGTTVCARRSTLLAWIAVQEGKAA